MKIELSEHISGVRAQKKPLFQINFPLGHILHYYTPCVVILFEVKSM